LSRLQRRVHPACISNDPSFDLNPELGKSINFDCFRPLVRASKDAGVKRFVFRLGARRSCAATAALVANLGVRSKLGRGGVQELRTHGARTQNDQSASANRSRLKTIIWLAVLLRNPSSQLVCFVDKRRVYEHFGQKARDAESLRGSALFPISCADRYSASHCGDLLV
jgi:hypothetical protein